MAYDQLVAVEPDNPGPQIGPYTDYSDAIKDSLDRLVLEGASVDAVVTGADEEIQDALDPLHRGQRLGHRPSRSASEARVLDAAGGGWQTGRSGGLASCGGRV